MGFKDTVRDIVVALLIERPAAQLALSDLARRLEKSGARLSTQFGATSDTPANRNQIRHIIGIERWGQRRLQVGLGEEPTRDEYDEYRPPEGLSAAALRGMFDETRRTTVELVRQIESRKVNPDTKVAHNDFGPITLRGWLNYLNTHANLESKKLRGI